MTSMMIVRRVALAAVALAVVSFMRIESEPAAAADAVPSAGGATADSSANPSVLRLQIQNAIDKGDIAAARRLIAKPRPAATASFTDRPNPVTLSQDTQYEELKACGFYPQETQLECTIEIKQATGYNGLIGDLGALEYVSFCVLIGNPGNYPSWHSLGIGSVQVHDESSASGGSPSWEYAVYRKFDPLGGMRDTGSSGQSVVTEQTTGQSFLVEAILSYSTPVPDCLATPTFGNTLYFVIRFDPRR